MVVAASTLDAMRPLPLAPGGSLRVAAGVDFLEHDGSGSVFLWGMAAWSWAGGDRVARRLAAVQLVESKAARQRQVATAFGVSEDTLIIWRGDYAASGSVGLAGRRPGPKGPSKLTDALREEIRALRAEGLSLLAVAGRTGVSTDTVRRALAAASAPAAPVEPAGGSALVPLARPADRSAERPAAHAGLITEAPPVICEGAGLPLVGALIILPALAATGLLEAAAQLYTTGRAAFYGLRSLLLAIVFACLVGEPRAEGLTRLDPVDAGRLLGLDRAPEVKTMRRRIEQLARLGRADRLIDALARRHLAVHGEASGIFYVDGHVRAYHGAREIPKAHVARIRLAMGAEVDTWVSDRNGDGILVWTAPPGASLAGELRSVMAKIRHLVGPDARPTICFDRGGWSPKLFRQLDRAGFDILTYRKGAAPSEPRTAFQPHRVSDERGRVHDYLLADRRVRIAYDNGRRRFACRQITRLDEASGHQTQVLTTRTDPDPAVLAHAMFHRWSQENFFRYMRAHYGLDALDSYATGDDDPTRLVPNPARRAADRTLAEARRQLATAHTTEGQASLLGHRPDTAVAAFANADQEIERLAAAAKAIPAKAPLSDVRPDALRLDPERKRIHDAVRMATYNAESALARLLAPHYRRADDEARSLLREAFRSPADLEIIDDQLHVRLAPLSAPRRTRAIAALCQQLTDTKTLYPGTNLTLVYTVHDHR